MEANSEGPMNLSHRAENPRSMTKDCKRAWQVSRGRPAGCSCSHRSIAVCSKILPSHAAVTCLWPACRLWDTERCAVSTVVILLEGIMSVRPADKGSSSQRALQHDFGETAGKLTSPHDISLNADYFPAPRLRGNF